MTEEELETTTRMHTMMLETDENTILDEIEEFEEKLEYLDLKEEKKKKLKEMCSEIKKEKNEDTIEYLFQLLQKEIEE